MPLQNLLSGISSAIVEVLTSLWLLSTIFRKGHRKDQDQLRRPGTRAFLIREQVSTVSRILTKVSFWAHEGSVILNTLSRTWRASQRRRGLDSSARNPLAQGAEDEKSDRSPPKSSHRRGKIRT